MRNSMVIKHCNTKQGHYTCSCVKCKAAPNSAIPTFYSFEHAIDSGWVATREEKFCKPDNNYVFVCPDCYNKQ